jgi:hypothetical protein
VQGDERDVIFISTTFGPAPGTNAVFQRFGPISQRDGWRRLNVLFTRARKSLTVFTSMRPEDIVDGEKRGIAAGASCARISNTYARAKCLRRATPNGPPDSDSRWPSWRPWSATDTTAHPSWVLLDTGSTLR